MNKNTIYLILIIIIYTILIVVFTVTIIKQQNVSKELNKVLQQTRDELGEMNIVMNEKFEATSLGMRNISKDIYKLNNLTGDFKKINSGISLSGNMVIS